MHKPLAALVVALFLAGCGFTSKGDQIRVTIRDATHRAATEGLINAEWWICKGAPTGAVEARYGRSRALADARRIICEGEADAQLIEPE